MVVPLALRFNRQDFANSFFSNHNNLAYVQFVDGVSLFLTPKAI